MLTSRQREAMRNAMVRYEADADAPCGRPLEFLLRSLARLEQGRFGAAQNDARRGRGKARDRVAGHLLFAAGAYGEGLDVLEDSAASPTLRLRLAQELGWTLDVLRVLASPHAPASLQRVAADVYARGGHPQGALEIAAGALKESPDDPELALLFAAVAPPGQHVRARRMLEGLPLFGNNRGLRCALLLRRVDGDARPQLEKCATSTALDIADVARAALARIAFEDGDNTAAREWCAEEILREALVMLGANRSWTCMSYVATTPNGLRRRFIQRLRPGGPTRASIAEGERGPLRTILGLSVAREAAGVGTRPSPEASPKPSQTKALEEHFEKHGYCVLRGAFSRDVASEWVRAATARIRAQPDVFVRGYEPLSAPLWNFDPSDPGTWTWRRIELLSQKRMTFEAFSPKLWTLLQSIAGPALAAKELSDYLVINMGGSHETVTRVSESRDWHVDDPSAGMSLDSLRNGLVLVMLFSDCDKGEGGTLLLDGSADVVARHLHQHPEGVDLSNGSLVRSLIHGLEGFTQVHGNAGDVYICSSLLVHSSAPNPSTRIRWMANPMLHLAEPPRLVGEEGTPLEKSLRRALQRSNVSRHGDDDL